MAAVTHGGPWTEADLLALPEDGRRYELLEGALLLNPPPAPRHQHASLKLAVQLLNSAPDSLLVLEGVGVRIPDGSVLIPDVLVVDRDPAMNSHSGVLDAAAVRLAVEIVSPSSRSMDRLTKPALYARAGIPNYWRVELDDRPQVFTYRLDGTNYSQGPATEMGQPLRVGEPYPVTIDPTALI